MKIKIDPFDPASIKAAAAQIRQYENDLKKKEREFVKRLGEVGVTVASVRFTGAVYDGTNDVKVVLTQHGHGATVTASGQAVMFIEFGSGVIGAGHELAAEHGYGPGTWSDGPQGKGHWQDPNGWYYAHGKKSKGNPPARAMLEARDEMVRQVTEIAREVWRNA